MDDYDGQRDMYRRQFLGVACGVSLSAGCLGFGGTNETVGVSITNEDSAARKITVRVSFDGTQLLDTTVTVESGETVNTHFKNPDNAGDARVIAKLAAGAESSKSIRVGPGTGIRYVTVVINQDESLRITAART